MSFEGKNLYGQYIDYSEKKMAQGLHLPLYWDYFLYHSYIQQISGGRLQDLWSSCFHSHRQCIRSLSIFFVVVVVVVFFFALNFILHGQSLAKVLNF